MFLSVLEVAVSSVPILVDNGIKASEIDASKSPVSFSLVGAAATVPQVGTPKSHRSDVTVDMAQTTVAPDKTLLPQESFQLVEPLNLANVAESINRALILSLSSSQVTGSSLTSLEKIPNNQAPVAAKEETAALNPHTSISPNPLLHQCTDVEKPQTDQGTTLQVVLRGTVIGEVSGITGAGHVVTSLKAMLADELIDSEDITPVLGAVPPTIRLSDDALLRIVNSDVPLNAQEVSNEWAAITWSDQLRQGMGAAPLDAGDVQVMLKGFKLSEQQLNGTASWYGPYFHGRLTANGETFDQHALTAAHKSLPFGTVLQVRNLKNNRTVVVRINDRGPYIGERSLDLSKAAAQCLGSQETGVIPYEAVILETSLASTQPD
ncbi:MAG: septal ring lytic transglycosylase RlpA family protein [Cyanobacteria bacterium P01_A01_bin.15]